MTEFEPQNYSEYLEGLRLQEQAASSQFRRTEAELARRDKRIGSLVQLGKWGVVAVAAVVVFIFRDIRGDNHRMNIENQKLQLEMIRDYIDKTDPDDYEHWQRKLSKIRSFVKTGGVAQFLEEEYRRLNEARSASDGAKSSRAERQATEAKRDAIVEAVRSTGGADQQLIAQLDSLNSIVSKYRAREIEFLQRESEAINLPFSLGTSCWNPEPRPPYTQSSFSEELRIRRSDFCRRATLVWSAGVAKHSGSGVRATLYHKQSSDEAWVSVATCGDQYNCGGEYEIFLEAGDDHTFKVDLKGPGDAPGYTIKAVVSEASYFLPPGNGVYKKLLAYGVMHMAKLADRAWAARKIAEDQGLAQYRSNPADGSETVVTWKDDRVVLEFLSESDRAHYGDVKNQIERLLWQVTEECSARAIRGEEVPVIDLVEALLSSLAYRSSSVGGSPSPM